MAQITGSYANCIPSVSSADGAVLSSTPVIIGTAIATEDLYPLLDFRLQKVSGTPTTNGKCILMRRAGDGTNQAPTPSTSHRVQEVGRFNLIASATANQFFYFYGVPNPDPEDSYYLLNESGTTCTFLVDVRGRDYV